MPQTYQQLFNSYRTAQQSGAFGQEQPISEFAKLGALVSKDPIYAEVANSGAWKNWLRSLNAGIQNTIDSGPFDEWSSKAVGAVGDVFGVNPESSRAMGAKLPRMVVDFLPMIVAGALAAPSGGTSLLPALGLGATSGMTALGAYGETGSGTEAAFAGAMPYLGGKLGQLGGKAALSRFGSAAGRLEGAEMTPAMRAAFGAGAEQLPAGARATGQWIGSAGDKATYWAGSQAGMMGGFAGLDAFRHGPESVMNREYWFNNAISTLPFIAHDVKQNMTSRWLERPEVTGPAPTDAQIAAEMTRGETFDAALKSLDPGQILARKRELGHDLGEFALKENDVRTALDSYDKAVEGNFGQLEQMWNQARATTPGLPEFSRDTKALTSSAEALASQDGLAALKQFAENQKSANTVRAGMLSRVAQQKVNTDRLLGLTEEELKLPETLLSKPVDYRTLQDYQTALQGKMSDDALKVFMMVHKQQQSQQGKGAFGRTPYSPEFPELYKQYLSAVNEGKISDPKNTALLTAGLMAKGRFPRVVEVKKKVEKQAKQEGLTQAEAEGKLGKSLSRAAQEPSQDRNEKRRAKAELLRQQKAQAIEAEIFRSQALDQRGEQEELYSTLGAYAKTIPQDRRNKFLASGEKIIKGPEDVKAKLEALDKLQNAPHGVDQGALSYEDEILNREQSIEERDETDPIDEMDQDVDSAVEEVIPDDPVAQTVVSKAVKADNANQLQEILISKLSNFLHSKLTGRQRVLNKPESIAAQLRQLEPRQLGVVVRDAVSKGFSLPKFAHSEGGSSNFTVGDLMTRDQFLENWLRENGVDEQVLPQHLQDFVRAAEFFNVGEARYGKLTQTGTVEVMPDEVVTIPEDLALAQEVASKGGNDWASKVDLSESVGAFRNKEGKLQLYDGHHRWLAAKILGKPLNVRAGNARFARGWEPEGTDLRTVKTGYESTEDSLLGLRKSGVNKSFHERGYKFQLPVEISVDGGKTWESDRVKGLNYPHAVEVAKRNWDSSILVRQGKLDTRFAKAQAGGGFDFGMAEFKDGKLYRAKGGAVTPRKGGILTLQEFKVAGGYDGMLTDGEIEFYKQLVPQAFTGDKVNVKELWEGLDKAGESVRVEVYGQADQGQAKLEFDAMTHDWFDNLTAKQRADYQEIQRLDNLVNRGWSAEQVQKAKRYKELENNVIGLGLEGGRPVATSYYDQISPFDTKKYPVVRVDVVLPPESLRSPEAREAHAAHARGEIVQLPWDKELWTPDNLHENLPNTLGWAMVQVVPGKDGQPVMFVGEAQSRWAQSLRPYEKAKASLKEDTESPPAINPRDKRWTYTDIRGNTRMLIARSKEEALRAIEKTFEFKPEEHPLLPIHQNLILKAVIKEAQKRGITKVAIADGETAMMTEGHDKRADIKGFSSREEAEANSPGSWGETVQEKDGTWTLKGVEDLTNQAAFTRLRQQGFRIETPQEGGMRLAYDTTLPSIMKKLVGEGEGADFGVHKSAKQKPDLSQTNDVIENLRLNQRQFQPDEEGYNFYESQIQNELAKANPPIGSPVFRNPDGTPKTNVTGKVYDISNPSPRLGNLFAQHGTVYGMTTPESASIYMPSKVWPGMNPKVAMLFDWAHEHGHNAIHKARQGGYGPEVQKLAQDIDLWAQKASEGDMTDLERVAYDLWLPKEFKGQKGVEDILRNKDPEEWITNMHSMLVMGAMRERPRSNALLFLPKPIRAMVEWTLTQLQGITQALKSWSKLNFNVGNIQQLNRVKNYMDSVRRSYREAEYKRQQAAEFLSTSPDSLTQHYARSRFGKTGPKGWVDEVFNNATMSVVALAAEHPREFKDPAMALTENMDLSMQGVVDGLAPILGKKAAFNDFKVDPNMPAYKIVQSKPLYDLIHEIDVHNQIDPKSVLVKQADGSVSFNPAMLAPAQRAKLKMYSPESQKLAAEFLMQREHAIGNTQELVTNSFTTIHDYNLASRIAKTTSYKGDYDSALVTARKVYNMLRTGDMSYVPEFEKLFGDLSEARSVMETAQEWSGHLQELKDFYAGRPNFQSLRRFGRFVQKYSKVGEPDKTLDFNSREEAVKYHKQLEEQGWKPNGPMKERNKEDRGRVVVEDNLMKIIDKMEQSVKNTVESSSLSDAEKSDFMSKLDFAGSIEREAKAADLYLPGVKRRVSGDPLNLDLMQQHILYTKAASKVATGKALEAQMEYLLGKTDANKESIYVNKPQELAMFKKLFKQSLTPDPKFWRKVMKANAVWHIGFNIPGHVVESFQPITTHVHELVAQGQGVFGSTNMVRKTFSDVGKAYAKLAKDKVLGKSDARIWEQFKDPDERKMLEELWPRFMRNPLREVNDVVGEDAENFRRVANGEKLLSPGEAITKPFAAYSNAAMGLYALPVRFNALSGLITGYRLAKKKGMGHEEAVKEAEYFEQLVNNSGGRLERPAYFSKFGDAGYLVYALSSYVRGRFNQFARYYRHGFDSDFKGDLTPKQRADARKAFGTMVAAQLGAAGLLGFPLVGTGIALMEDVLNEDIKGKGLEALNEVTEDETLTRALSHGVMSTMAENLGIPADLQSRFALSGFLGLNSYDGISSSSLLGPTASMVKSMWNFGKAFAQEPDIGKALQKGGPQGIKRLAEALGEEFQSNNSDASPALSLLGFRSGQSFKRKELRNIIERKQDEDFKNMSRASERIYETLKLGPEKAQETLWEEAQKLTPQSLEGPERMLVLKQTMQQLRQRVADIEVKTKIPQDLRSSGTPRTSPAIEAVSRAIGYSPPGPSLVQKEMLLRQIYGDLGTRRSPTALRQAGQREAQLQMNPQMFY